MKKLLSLALTGALALTFAVGAAAGFADSHEIKMGTATVDGKLDEAYKYSFVIEDFGTGTNNFLKDDPNNISYINWNSTMTADIYVMYDKDNLYIFVDGKDDDITTRGQAYASDLNNPWQNDTVEFRLSFNGDVNSTMKFGVDAYGYGLYGLTADYDKFDYETVDYEVVRTDNTFAIELAIPCSKGETDMIKAGKLGIKCQLNDTSADGATTSFAPSWDGEGTKQPVFIKLSTEEAKAPTTGGTTTGGTTGGTTTGETNPDTFDPAIIAVALTAISGVAFVVASKKH